MPKIYDVVVVGLGGVGSAALYQLAKNGAKAVGIDKFSPPHNLGSSHGDTRIIRQAIGEGNFYMPLVRRSYEIWRDLENQTGLDLLTTCGGIIMVSPADKSVIHGSQDFFGETISVAQKYGIPHSILNAYDIQTRFPQFNLVGDEKGYHEPMAGFLRPENCVKANLMAARQLGAEISVHDKVINIIPTGNGVIVQAESDAYHAQKVIVSAGAWISKLMPRYASLFTVSRQVQYWFDVEGSYHEFTKDKFPVFIWQKDGGITYGFPAIDGPKGGLKIASETNDIVDPDSVSREVSAKEIIKMHIEKVFNAIPALGPKCIKAVSCLYTNTTDSHFVIDFHPEFPQIIIASACSGHGFKHSAAIGQLLAELTLDGRSKFDINNFGLKRFEKGA